MQLSIIVPVYNEAHLLCSFWTQIKKTPIHLCAGINAVEIILVDDGSTDGSYEILTALAAEGMVFQSALRAEVWLFRNEKNRGKGCAVRVGIDASQGDILLIQDSDLEYSPDDYPALIKPITDDHADAVFGSRFVGSPRRVMYYWHALFNSLLTGLSNILNDVNLTDMETGYKVMRGPLARALQLSSNRFGIEPELTARLAKSKSRLYEVPISYRGRTYEEGKKIGAWDGLAALFHIFRFGLLSTEPFKPGLMQTLTALDSASSVIYSPLLYKALADLKPRGRPLRILEIGAGIGSLTKILVRFGVVTATDISPDYVRTLQNRFELIDGFSAFVWDATQDPKPGMGAYDLIVSFNVLEHLEDDRRALGIWNSMLAPGGSMVVLVPYGPKLYSPIDKALGHFRRYTSADLRDKVTSTNFRVQRLFFGNAFGILGWFVAGILLRKRDLPARQLRSYILLKKIFGRVEKLLERHVGLSIIVVALRQEPAS